MLNKIQNLKARLVTSIFRSSPIESLLNISDLLSLDIKRRESSISFKAKLENNNMISAVTSSPSLVTIIPENKLT